MSKTLCNTYFLLLAAFFAVSCSSLRKGVDYGRTIQISSMQLYHSVDTAQLSFHSFSAKLSCDLVSKDVNQSLKGNLRIVHDSAIWISVSPGLGIEAARLLLTPDSIFLLNRLKSTYIRGKFTEIRQLLNVDVDFAMIEALLTNRVFKYPTSSGQLKDFNDFNLNIKSKEYQLEDVNKSVSTTFIVNPIYHLILSLVKFDQRKMFIEAHYSDFAVVDLHQFPLTAIINAGTLDKKITVHTTYSKIEINQQLEFPFRIPESYKQAKF